MSTDFGSEPLLTFSQAAKLLPVDRRPAYITWYRWWRHGIRGVKLETHCVGGRRYTNRTSLRKFCDALSSSPGQSKPTSPKSRERDVRRAEKALAEWGV